MTKKNVWKQTFQTFQTNPHKRKMARNAPDSRAHVAKISGVLVQLCSNVAQRFKGGWANVKGPVGRQQHSLVSFPHNEPPRT